MPILPPALRPRREKVFGNKPGPLLDRNEMCKLMAYVRAQMRRTAPGKHYGAITAKAMAVLTALVWKFHNTKDGRCMPSYETIAEAAGCARSTVAVAIKALEAIGVMTWVNRITKIRERERDLFGQWTLRWRVIRISNAYAFRLPAGLARHPRASKSENPTGPINPDSSPSSKLPSPADIDDEQLRFALTSLGRALGAAV